MADATTKENDRLPMVQLVASVRGFYRGAMVEPGQKFLFDPNPREPGGKVKWPKWAAPVGEQAAKKAPEPAKAFDTKPPAAQAAARKKAGALSGGN